MGTFSREDPASNRGTDGSVAPYGSKNQALLIAVLFFCLFVLRLCRSGWAGTHKTRLEFELRNPPSSASKCWEARDVPPRSALLYYLTWYPL